MGDRLPRGFGWWTVDTDAEGDLVYKRTRVHAFDEDPPVDEDGLVLDGADVVTRCGIQLRSWWNEYPLFPGEITCRRCLRSIMVERYGSQRRAA